MIFILLFLLQFAQAQPTPPPLDGWDEWILKDHPDHKCPMVDAKKQCLWMGKLKLDIRKDGATFQQHLFLDTPRYVEIVGGSGFWPFGVRSEQGLLPVVDINGRPSLKLAAGHHVISGELDWPEPPSNLPVPKGIAQILCFEDSTPIESQYSTTEGLLRIGDDALESQIQVRVLRRIEDGHPATVETHIWMTSTGGHQPIDIGNPFLEGAHPLLIESRLGTQLSESQSLIVQPLPGEHRILIRSIFPKAPTQLTSQNQSTIWPENEHWVFLPDPTFRTIQVSGAQSVDRERAAFPDEWTERSVYEVAPLVGLTLSELHRGDPQPPPNQLRLQRNIWLDSDGVGVSIRDELSGRMSQGWRLSRSQDATLGSFNIDNIPQVITNFENGTGVEIRHAESTIFAESRVENRENISTVGWNIQPESLYTVLHLPPGWELITASGGAEIKNGFWNNTLLLKIILIFALAAIIGKLSRRRWGAVLGLALLMYSNWSIPLLLYVAVSLVILAYKHNAKLYRRFRLIVLFLFMGFVLDLGYNESIRILYPASDSTQLDGDDEPRYSEIIDYGVQSARTKSVFSKVESWQQNIPNAIAQTGMGTPTWSGEIYHLNWNDKWIPDVPMKLILMSPSEKRLLDCFRIFLLFYGLWQLLGLRLPQPQSIAVILLLPTVGINAAHADSPPGALQNDFIDEIREAPFDLYTEYKNELLKPPDCQGNCLSTSHLIITAEDQSLNLQAEVHALTNSYWILPGTTAQLTLEAVLLNGQPTIQLHQDQEGRIAIRVSKGVSVVEAKISLLSPGATPLELHQKTHQLNFRSKTWSIEGLRPNMVPEPIIKLIPEKATSAKSLQPHSLLHRHFDIGHQWRVENTLRRNPSTKGPLTVNVPLLPGEQVLDPNVLVNEGASVISLTTEQHEAKWISQLPSSNELVVTAGDGLQYIEQWTILCAVMHHCVVDGIYASQHITAGLWTPLFQPQPNERIDLSVEELTAAQGQTRTIDEVSIEHELGANTIQTYIELQIRSATEGNFSIDLPDRQITNLMLNGSDIPIVQHGSALQIPHGFGESTIQLSTSMPQDGWFQEVPSPTLPSPAVNISMSMSQSQHWLIHFFAPKWGSKSLLPLHILFWLILAFFLAKIPRSPLSLPLWVVLFMITIPMPVELTLVLSAPLLLSRLISPTSTYKKFLALAFFALFVGVGIIMLIYAILESPHLVTTDGSLSWRIDRSDGNLPPIQLVQAPRFLWKILVLIWAAFVGRIIWRQGHWLGQSIRDIIAVIIESSKSKEPQSEETETLPFETSDE